MSDQITQPEDRPEKPKTKRGPLIAIAAGAAVAVAAAVIIPLSIDAANDSAPAVAAGDEERVSVRLGVNDIGKSFWQLLVDKAADENIDIELVSFTDYNTPNPALSGDEIDINKFQHTRYLAQYNASQDEDLVPIGASEIYPIGFYSKKWDSVEDVPKGAEVTLSNNPANQVRPLLALYNAGLVEFTVEADWNVTLDDVDFSKSTIGTITPIDPTQTAASLDSVDVAFVDSTFAGPAGLTADQKIYTEDVDREDLGQYINIFAVRAEDADNPALLKIVELYHSPEIEQAIRDEEGGFEGVFKTTSKEELAKILAEQLTQFQ